MRNKSRAAFLLALSFSGLIGHSSSGLAGPITFTPASGPFVAQDIGGPGIAGTVTPVAGGYDITAGGTNINGAADQFTFNYQLVAGNFDYKVRLAGLTLADSWTKAGLMGRETLL